MRDHLTIIVVLATVVLSIRPATARMAQTPAGLQGRATISGTVTNADTGSPVAGASVIVRRKGAAPSDPTAPTTTDARGQYRSPGLPTGDYTVEAWPPPSSPSLLRLIFGGRPCTYSGCPAAEGTPVHASEPNDTAAIDFALPVGGSISGRLTDAVSHESLAYVLVTARSDSFHARAVSRSDGGYTIEALLTGSYGVEARPAWEGVLGAGLDQARRLERFETQMYRTPVRVTAPRATANIDFALRSK